MIEKGHFMDCLKAQTCITSYVEEELAGNDLKEFLLHVEHCENCREELEIYYTLLVATKQLDEGILTTSNFARELDDKIKMQLNEMNHWERLNRRTHIAFVFVGLFFVLWAGIKWLKIPVPVLNPPQVTWEQQKYFMEVKLLPHMFQPVIETEKQGSLFLN